MTNPNKNPTIVDVAQRAGVSTATASRVLSNADYPVSPELRRRVIKASSDLNYVPNIFGKMLKSNISDAIGVIVPSLQNPFYNQVVIGIEAAATKCGREIRLFSSHRNVAQERSNILNLLNSRIMSLIILSIDSDPEALKNYIGCGGKVALLEADFKLEDAIQVETDTLEAGRLAAQHLIDLGHREIAFLTSPFTKSFRHQKLAGIQAAMRAANCPFSDKNIFVAHAEEESDTSLYEFEMGRQLTEELLSCGRKYTAIIAINDITAFGIIQALNDHGLSVPEDMSVIGCDNIIYSKMIYPPLTTVELPSSSMGRIACQMLISAADSGMSGLHGVSLKFPGLLQVRNSTCAPA